MLQQLFVKGFRAPLVVAMMALLAPLSAIAEESDSEWVKVETANFTIFSQAGGNVGRWVAADLERLHHALSELAPSNHLDSPLPSYFYIFRDEASLIPYRQASSSGSPSKQKASLRPVQGEVEIIGGEPLTAGYVVPHEHGNYAVVVGGEDFVPTRYVYKQYIHHRLHADHASLPMWFRQGVAEYFSSFKTEGDLAIIGLPTEEHVAWIRRRPKLAPVAQLIRVDTDEMAKSSQDLRYQYFKQSWALFHYLHNGRQDTRKRIPRFVEKIALGDGLEEAFRSAYELDPDQLDAELRAYIREGALTYLEVPVKKLDLLITKTITLREHEALYHLGDLLARAVDGKADAASAHFARALQLNPDHGPSWSGLGYLAETAGADALGHYRKAAAKAPDDFLTQFLYGKSLLKTLDGKRPADEPQEKTLQQAIDALQKSVELRNRFSEAWASLGYAYGLETQPSDAGVEALQRAIGFFPERSDLALSLLLAHARRNEREDAEAVFSKMVQAGADAGTLSRAQEIRLQMDYREAAQLVRKSRVDDAIALFVRIQTETRDPALKQKVDEQLDKLSIVGDFRAFIDLYNAAAQAINSGDMGKGKTLVDQLAAGASEPWQLGQVKKLRRSLQAHQ